MKNYLKYLDYIMGRVHIPKNLLDTNEDLLLHISDTPTVFYKPLNILIKKLRPKYIVHTGDLVDNIKIGLYPKRIDLYIKGVKSLIDMLENSCAKEIYLVLGNHDRYDIVKKSTNRCVIFKKTGIINIENRDIKISHFSNEVLKKPKDINLFGHDTSLLNKIVNEKVFLNGILGINIISIPSNNIYILKYPYGINDQRLGTSNIGF